MIIQEVSVLDVLAAPEYPALIEEYAREASIEGMPEPRAKIESYAAYAQSGMLHVFGALAGKELVGFITILAPVMPHYSCPGAVTESFFVASAHRAGGPGLRLLAAAEQRAAEVGSPVLQVCAPMGGRLFQLLPKCGYVETNRVFTKRLYIKSGCLVSIPSSTPSEVSIVRRLQEHQLATEPQIDLEYQHVLHAGVYDRTVLVPAGYTITGAPVKIPTLLTIVGDVIIGLDDNEERVTGFAKIEAAAHRMGVFTAIKDTFISMSFATDAKTVAEAEAEFTDEAHRLASRRQECPA